MRKSPKPRPHVFDLYWYFATERQAIFERRVAGQAPPWTDDPILQEFKFCNVYRACDRANQYLLRDIEYHAEQTAALDRIFQIITFRLFSRIETWRGIRAYLNRNPNLKDLEDGLFTQAVEHVKEINGVLYTGAFILCAADAFGQGKKHLNHVELLRQMFLRDSLGEQLLCARSLTELYNLVHSYPLMGDFMSYQVAVDLNYSDLINFDENDFTKPGPGALRGMKKAFEDLGDYSPSEVVLWMVEQQDNEFERRGFPFTGLWGRPLHAIDCQGLFCELDKYCREAVPSLASTRKRIKARFVPSSEPIEFFFPPKWGINEKIPQPRALMPLLDARQLPL